MAAGPAWREDDVQDVYPPATRRRSAPLVAVSLAGAILLTAVATGSLWRPVPRSVADPASFGWPTLVSGRWWTLFTSLFVTRGPFMAVTMPAAVAAGLGVYERRAGSQRALAVAAVGHVTGSVLVAVVSGAIGRFGWPFAVSAAGNVDYGASMVVSAGLGALAAELPRLGPFVGASALLALVVHHQLADWAHVVAVLAAFLVARVRTLPAAGAALAGTAALTAWLVAGGWRLVS